MPILGHASAARNADSPGAALARAAIAHLSAREGVWWTAAPHATDGVAVAVRVPHDSDVAEHARITGQVRCLALIDAAWCELVCSATVVDGAGADRTVELWLVPAGAIEPVVDDGAVIPRT